MENPDFARRSATESGCFAPRANADTGLYGQCAYHVGNDGLRFFMHFSIRRILNRMLNKDAMRVGHTQGIRLSRCRSDELGRRDGYRWRSLNLKPYRVMQTARGTGASVS